MFRYFCRMSLQKLIFTSSIDNVCKFMHGYLYTNTDYDSFLYYFKGIYETYMPSP